MSCIAELTRRLDKQVNSLFRNEPRHTNNALSMTYARRSGEYVCVITIRRHLNGIFKRLGDRMRRSDKNSAASP
jgi:hypothetical protein